MKTLGKASLRFIRLILLAILGLVTTLSIPALSVQKVLEHPTVITQTSNPQSLLQQGIESYQQEDFPTAIALWQQAGQGFKSQDDILNQALVWNNLSLAYQHLGKLTEAENAIESSLKLLQTLPGTNSVGILAKALNTQGRLLWSQGKPELALETWKQATQYYAQAGQEIGVIGSLINQSKALQTLGLSSEAAKKLDSIYKRLEQQSDPYLKATGLLNFSKALRRVGKLERAKEVLQNGEEIAPKLTPAVNASIQLELGNIHRALADKNRVIGKIKAAKEETKKALYFYQQANQTPNSSQEIQASLNQLSLLIEAKKYLLIDDNEYLKVTNILSLIQTQIETLGEGRTSIYAQLNYAKSLIKLLEQRQVSPTQFPFNSKLLKSQEIAQFLANIVQQARALQDSKAESYALGQLGNLYEQNQQWSAAQKLTEKALLSIESIQAPNLQYLWKWQLGRVLKQKGDTEQAISAYKNAITTLNSVEQDLVHVDSDLQFSFQENIEPLYRQLIDLLLPDENLTIAEKKDSQTAQARNQIKLLQRAELESFLQCSLQDIKEQKIDNLVDRDNSTEAVIYPILLENRLGILLRLPNSEQLLAYSSPLPDEEDMAQILTELQRDLRFAGQKKAVQKNAQKLYQLLITPLEEELKINQIDTLVFVLDSPFRNIPMSVLYDGEQYLIEKYAVAITSGLELLESQTLSSENLKAALAGLTESRRGYSPLENVESQFDKIQTEITSEVILNDKFTLEGFQNLLNSLPFPVVHIATHGQFSSQRSETFLVAWNENIHIDDLRNLLQGRAQTRPEPVELLVLAACETSQGDKRAALGLAGIAVRAGARSTLATLWKIIADESPGELLSQFYTNLRDHPEMNKAEALRLAQLNFLEDNNRNSPYYWAPYILIGNWF